MGGIHIIAIFETNRGTKDIEGILSKLDLKPDQFGKVKALVEKHPGEVIEAVHRREGLAVLAHANSSHGVLKDMEGESRTKVIKNKYLMAAEATDYESDTKKQKGKRVVD